MKNRKITNIKIDYDDSDEVILDDYVDDVFFDDYSNDDHETNDETDYDDIFDVNYTTNRTYEQDKNVLNDIKLSHIEKYLREKKLENINKNNGT